MIPVRLQLKNFLSYGPTLQTIDFSHYPLICLSGKNGHGKSALLDAITWALWGQARKTSGTIKADEGLVHLGQTQMLVAYDFEFNGQLYRVRREFAITYGKPLASLEFGLLDADKETLIPLTGKTIRETQAKIEQTLHLDFEAFSNSAFLRQGSANEFSKKSPKERKQILASILGLDQYDSIKKLAMEKIRTALTQQHTIERLDQAVTEELKHAPSIKTEIKDATNALQEIEKKEKAWVKESQEFEKKQQALVVKQKEFHALQATHKQLLEQEETLLTRLKDTRTHWRTINKSYWALPNFEHLESERKKVTKVAFEQQELLHKQLRIKEDLLKAREALHACEQKLNQEHVTAQQKQTLALEQLKLERTSHERALEDLKKQHEELHKEHATLDKQLKELQKKEKEATAYEKTINSIEKQFNKRKDYYQRFIAEGNLIKQELENLKQKHALTQDVNNPSCPLCEQNLSVSRKRFLTEKFNKEKLFYTHRLTRLRTLITNLKALLIEQHKELTVQHQHLNDLTVIRSSLEHLNKQQTTLDQSIEKNKKAHAEHERSTKEIEHNIKEATKSLETITKAQEQNIKEHPTYKEQSAVYTKLVTAFKAATYNENQHAEARKKLQELEESLAQYETIKKETKLQDQRFETVRATCTALKELRVKKSEFEKQRAPYHTLVDDEKALLNNKEALMQQMRTIQKEKEALLEKKGRLENQVEKLGKLEKQHKEHLKTINELKESAFDYQAIAMATSKDGIQALLIEDAIPEIEQEANQLLAKLTDNQAQLFIESLRDLKKGGTKETLDIKISDAAGVRPYELFSGGEAFRIDFALRIAISKLLARRANTSLQTLIIDEGFGSQDDEGLAHIMDALHKIQDDFAKIIIVSHLPSMKDQFPIHFMVEKGAQGSSVRILEQG